MDRVRLKFVGGLCIFYAAAVVPMFAVALYAGEAGGAIDVVVNVPLSILDLFIYLCILSTLRHVLSEHLDFWRADGLIVTLMVFSVLYSLIDISGTLVGSALDTIVTVAAALGLIGFGVVSILLAVRLLPLRSQFPEIGGYAYALLAEGILMCSVLLLPLALVADMIATVFLGLAFLRLANDEGVCEGSPDAHVVE